MLKISRSTKSTTRLGKGSVGVGSNGSDDGGHIDGGSRNGHSDRNSSDAPKLICLPTPCTSRFRTSASTDLSINTTKIVIDFDGVDGDGGCNSGFNVTFQVTRWRFRHCLSKKTVVLDYESEADHENPIPVALDWSSTLLVEMSIPIGKSSLPRVRQV